MVITTWPTLMLWLNDGTHLRDPFSLYRHHPFSLVPHVSHRISGCTGRVKPALGKVSLCYDNWPQAAPSLYGVVVIND